MEALVSQLQAIQKAAKELEKALNECPYDVKVYVTLRHKLGNETVFVNVLAELQL